MNAKPAIRFLSGLIVLVAAAASLWAAWRFVTSLPAESALALAGVAGGIVGVGYGKIQDRNNEILARQREKKAEIYQRFMDLWLAGEAQSQRGAKKDDPLNKSHRDMLLWASDTVLQKYAALMRHTIVNGSVVTEQALNQFAGVILEMRRDLNYKDKKTSPDDILTFLGKETGQWAFWPAPSKTPEEPLPTPVHDAEPMTVRDVIGPKR